MSDTVLREKISRGVLEAYKTEGYVKEDGSQDPAKVREVMYELLRTAKVINRRERPEKAITRGTLVEKIFPHLAQQKTALTEGTDEEPSDGAAENLVIFNEIWKKIDTTLWSDTRPNASGALQRLIGISMGNGYILVRTKIGKENTQAVYITDEVRCIEEDFVGPDTLSLQRKISDVTSNREMLIIRQPANGPRWKKNLDGQLKALSAGASNRLALAIESVSTNGAGAAEDDDLDDAEGTES
jgi:hypothetical protein